MAVKVKVDIAKVQAKIESTVNSGMGMLANEILNDCNLYCKEDTGTLIQSSYIHSRLNEGKLIWQTPYAKRQYYEIRTSLTPGRTFKWCETAKARHKTEWGRKAQRIMEMVK